MFENKLIRAWGWKPEVNFLDGLRREKSIPRIELEPSMETTPIFICAHIEN
jgi:hypothetical protein